jgi:hypothetical protein
MLALIGTDQVITVDGGRGIMPEPRGRHEAYL